MEEEVNIKQEIEEPNKDVVETSEQEISKEVQNKIEIKYEEEKEQMQKITGERIEKEIPPMSKSEEISDIEVEKQGEIEERLILDTSKETTIVEEESEKQKEYLYVYGIINNKSDKNLKLKIRGLKNEPIEKVDFKDISALISIYPTLRITLNEDEAMQHADILKKIAKKTTLIPMSFGTIFKDKKILEAILSKSYLAIKQTLVLIDGKIELGVKVVKAQFEDVPNGTALEILKQLDKLSVKSVKGDNFSERLLLNHSFLVEKNEFSKFSKEISRLEDNYKDLKFIYSGPWPPFSFVNIKIGGS